MPGQTSKAQTSWSKWFVQTLSKAVAQSRVCLPPTRYLNGLFFLWPTPAGPQLVWWCPGGQRGCIKWTTSYLFSLKTRQVLIWAVAAFLLTNRAHLHLSYVLLLSCIIVWPCRVFLSHAGTHTHCARSIFTVNAAFIYTQSVSAWFNCRYPSSELFGSSQVLVCEV